MSIISLIKERRSVRSYKDQPVEDSVLETILEAARLSPSARNLQERRFVVVRNPETRKYLATIASSQSFLAEAPVILAGCATLTDYVMRGGQLAYPIDLAIAIDHITLQATAMGLGSCWIGSFDEEKTRTVLKIPSTIRIVCLLTLGYSADAPGPKDRVSLSEMVCYEEWQ